MLAWQRHSRGQEEGTQLGELQSSHSGCEESGQDKKRSRHLQKVIDEIVEPRAGEVRIGRVKAHMGIRRNEVTDVCAKQAAEGVTLDDQCPEEGSGSGRSKGRGNI